MNRLKALPWTQFLLVLLLISSVMNYIELGRVKKAVDYVWSEVQGNDVGAQLGEIEKQMEESNQHLRNIEFSARCQENRYQPGCTIPLHCNK